ncbi:hypothetical protein BDN70DRAFT_916765 [Pholiota conissans]|uniref:DUF6535 domain-containing protein n=1 Tax=Pholiota conissans TaxID=109636 RepID=A0A9P5ZFC9_9AGAR|nr:hypothetical protein BDN70DRAFT_916765 [Pholiota conissans]
MSVLSMASNTEDLNPLSWKSTDEYKYPVPKPQGDHWEIILERFLTKDKSQCDAWKDEVQNLLLFAGLFSAVVTAFAVESYKTLQQDPNVALAVLLANIAAGIDTLANNTNPSVQSTPNVEPDVSVSFSPSSTSIRINIFWFSSLILSLATVIVGIVSLQWLREHQRYSEPLNPKQSLAVFHLRSAALRMWGIPHVFTILPLILQTAVILFFIGLGEFLFVLSPAVAASAFGLISLPILFLIATTILPTLQLLLVSFQISSDYSMPSQCAYKSPQSWAFLHLFLLGMRISYFLHRILGYISWPNQFMASLETISSVFSKATINILAKLHVCMIELPLDVHAACNRQNWVEFDITWLAFRDAHYLSQQKSALIWADDIFRPSYDLVQALVTSAKEHAIYEPVVLAAYHGMKELCDAIVADEILDLEPHHSKSELEMIRAARVAALQSGFTPFRSEHFQEKTFGLHIIRDEMILAFLRLPGIYSHSSNPTHPIGLHRMEIFTRLLVRNRFRGVGPETREIDPAHPFLAEINRVENDWEKTEAFPEDMIQQQYITLEHILDLALEPSSYEVITGARYSLLAKYFNYISSFRCPENLESDFLSILSTISKGFTFSIESQRYENADFLFFVARLYFENLAQHLWFSDYMKFGPYRIRRTFISLLEIMLRYEHQMDKLAYNNITRPWETGLHASNSHTTIYPPTPVRFTYEPIPETLLRFLPYHSKFHVPIDMVTVFADKLAPVDSDGESMAFAVSLNNSETWSQL